jgi:hypothetical protein
MSDQDCHPTRFVASEIDFLDLTPLGIRTGLQRYGFIQVAGRMIEA